jgi:hypothetical protein
MPQRLREIAAYTVMKKAVDCDLSIAVPPRLPAPLNVLLLTQRGKTPNFQAARGSRRNRLHQRDAK